MNLSREIEDPGVSLAFVKIGLTYPDLLLFTPFEIILIHARKSQSKLKGKTTAHNTKTVYGVYYSLHWYIEDGSISIPNHWGPLRLKVQRCISFYRNCNIIRSCGTNLGHASRVTENCANSLDAD